MNSNDSPVKIYSNGLCRIDGIEYPAVGFGTYPSRGDVCVSAVAAALKAGYRIIDTATFYQNFEPISQAIKNYPRNSLYIISKVWPDSHTREKLQSDLKTTLSGLKIDYLDTYFLHWPNSQVPIEETLQTLDEFREQGLIKHIGLSNVSVNHLARALELGIPITWVQVEMSPFYYDPELIVFCEEEGITVQAYRPLGKGWTSEDALLNRLAEKYGKTSSQIAIKWILQHGCLPLPGSKTVNHIADNIDVMNTMLSDEDVNEINARAFFGQRLRVTLESGLGFTDEFDYTYEQCWPR